MLSQSNANELIQVSKKIVDRSPINFPISGGSIQVKARSTDDEREEFLFDVNRRGRINLKKCTYQERYAVIEILLRLDINGPAHTNPDGNEISCPHIHIYKEGYGDKWAYALPESFTDPDNIVKTFKEFLEYTHVVEIPEIQLGIN